ncbi:MAG: hypothetical protein ILNGONEN_02436 [Syntrophorhabdaceae bacterium]|nr:hypothetical protein [Syntrophorhabdaceae bacterium]
MPLPGGAANKFGNRYEGIWTVRCMLDVMAARAGSIRLEPPGADGDGVEFWLKIGDSLQYHQVKRQNSPSGNWTIADLGSKGILEHFWNKLQNPLSSCVFVSTNSAFQFEELSGRSRCAKLFTEFKRDFLKAEFVHDAFTELCARWNNCSEQETFSALQRIEVETIGERTLRSTAERELGILIDGSAANAVDVLAQFALNKIHHELSADDIWKHLENRGFFRRQSTKNEPVIGDYGRPTPLYFVGRAEILDELAKAIKHNSIIVVGGLAGIGKTYLVSRYVENIDVNRAVLWLDCGTYGQIEGALVHFAEFFSYKFGDETLSRLLRRPLNSVDGRIKVAVSLFEKYQCILVWDSFDPETHKTLFPFLQECNRIFREGRILITSRTSVNFTTAINPVYRLVVPPLSQESGIELMRYYIIRLGVENYPDEILAQAHERVDGHPYFLRTLIVLSETFPLLDILKSLPQFKLQIQNYIQEQVFNQLNEVDRTLISRLSVLRVPFTLAAIRSFYDTSEATTSLDNLLRKFLITRQTRISSFYEIHDLVREYGLSQLTSEQTQHAHIQAADYYETLDQKTYRDGMELVDHLLEAKLQSRAKNATEHLLGVAIHEGRFDLVIEYTSHLFENKQTQSWGTVHFARGRAFRMKEKESDALKSYENALAQAGDDHLAEKAKAEIASMLVKLGRNDNRKKYISRAKKIYYALTYSKNIEMQVLGLTSLGFISIKGKHKTKAISQLSKALEIAEKAQLKRRIREIHYGLGMAYADNNPQKAIQYLERALALRQEIHSQYGEQDIEADYYLFDALAKAYRNQKRFDDAVRVSHECVSIDKKLGISERLAHSLFQLGKDYCLLKKYDMAKDVLEESLTLVKRLELHGEPEAVALEWLATALWHSQLFEMAIESILEYVFLNQHRKGFFGKHVVIREVDSINDSRVDFRGLSIHLLILPSAYDLDDLQQWTERIVSRRPELASVKAMLLHKGLREQSIKL